MEYTKNTLYTINGTSIVANEYHKTDEILEQLTWNDIVPLKRVSEYTSKKNWTPHSIAVLDSQDMIFVGYRNSCVTLGPNLIAIPGLSMRDVNLLLVQGNTVVAITSSSIRIMTATADKLQPTKSIEHPNILAAAIAGSSLLVATSEVYELIDLTIDSKIPLFPTPELPITFAINSHEFLVVQGTGPSDPAIGLMVKFTGEASRQPITWDSYPLQAHADCGNIIALFETKVTLHSIATQELVHEWSLKEIWPYPETPKLSKTHAFPTKSNDERVGILDIDSRTALYHESRVVWLVPPTQLAVLETQIQNGEKVDLENFDGPQREYLEIYQCLSRLKHASPQSSLPPASLVSIILHIFGDKEDLELPFPGLEQLISQLKAMEKSEALKNLYQRFLKTVHPRTPKIEKILASLLSGKDLVEFLATATIGSELAKQSGDDTLQEYYLRTGQRQNLLDFWYIKISESPLYAKKIVSYLAKIDNDPDLVWKEATRLIKVAPKTGVSLFTKQAKAQFDPELILETLDKIQSRGVAWRIYLKHLVYVKGRKVFAQDLVMVVVQDLIDIYTKQPEVSKLVAESYKKYRNLGWPKRPYFNFLQAQEKSPKFDEFVNLELEFASLVKDGTDMAALISIIDEHAPDLYVERCAVYRKLELHTQCLDFLVKDITDYAAAIWYCLYDSNGKPHLPEVRQDLAKYTLQQFLKLDAPTPVVVEHLDKQQGIMSAEYIISSVPEETSMAAVGTTLKWHFEQLRNKRTYTNLAKTLSIGESRWFDSALQDLKNHQNE